MTTSTPSSTQMSPYQQNDLARQLILQQALERIQSVFSQSVNPANNNNVINVQPRNVGLIKGFIVDVNATVSNTGTATATLTSLGALCALSNVTYTDLDNNTRINTTGYHIGLVNSARSKRPYNVALTPDSAPVGYGNNLNVMSASSTIASGASGSVQMRYYVPLAYSDSDLKGAVYGSVVNATQNLQLTVNPQFISANAANPTGVYEGSAGSVTNVSVDVYQVYLDQLPVGKNGAPVLPLLDLSTVYELKNTQLGSIAANQDYPIPYSNFRSFLSTFLIYNNGGTLNPGTDINYFTLQSANYTNIFKYSPFINAMMNRNDIGTDYPSGVYYFSSRKKPIDTNQYGNMELIVNPSLVNAGAQFLIGYEDFALVNVLGNAGSLPGAVA